MTRAEIIAQAVIDHLREKHVLLDLCDREELAFVILHEVSEALQVDSVAEVLSEEVP